jgi:uncharacterized membrane protein
MSKVEEFLTPAEEKAVVEAIRTAEKNTSGEIRVHLEAKYNTPDHPVQDVFERAVQVFDFLHMGNTKNNNGVLIYVAVADKQLVILGDTGINEVVPNNFWESTKDQITNYFKQGKIKEGLVAGILEAGKQLKKYFPFQKNDTNELPNTISSD